MTLLTHTQAEAVAYQEGRFSSGEFALKMTKGQAVAGDHLLIATGRPPNIQDLALVRAGVHVNKGGAIVVDDHMHLLSER